jgi:hypothetical protein
MCTRFCSVFTLLPFSLSPPQQIQHFQSFYEAGFALIPKPNKCKKRKLQPVLLMNTDAKFSNKMLTNKKIVYHDQVRFIQGMKRWFGTWKPIQFISGLKKKIIWTFLQMQKKRDTI